MPTLVLSKEVEKIVRHAMGDAHSRGHDYATVEHLCYALLASAEVMIVLGQCGVNVDKIRRNIDSFLTHEMDTQPPGEEFQTLPSLGFQRVLQRSAVHVMGAGKDEVQPYHVLVALFAEEDSHAVYLLKKAGLTRLDVVTVISHGLPDELAAAMDAHDDHDSDDDDDDDDEEFQSARKDPLQAYAVDLNAKAKNGELDVLVGRERELERTMHILLRRRKNNPLFVGEAGVGKTAIAEGLAQRIVEGKVPEQLKDAEIFALDMGALLAGTRYRGDFENRLKSIMHALEAKPKAILLIDEIHTVIGAGASSAGSMDASNLLKPALASGKMRCIGSTTYKEFRTHFEKDRALVRRFQKIDVDEPSETECIAILRGLRGKYEEYHGVVIEEAALVAAVKLSTRHLHDRKLPDKAIDLIDEAAAGLKLKVRPENSTEDFKWTVTPKHIEETVARIAQIPTKQVTSDDKRALASLETRLNSVVFGQERPIAQLASAIKLARAGLREAEKPIGSYLFSGPTGVGKTEVAKQLASIMGITFIRFDMSEYMERHTVSRLVGAPPGYVGFEQGGLLTDAINKTPHAVLLLDEIEKAHSDVFNMLLQVMDYGKLTDANGRPTDFRHVVLIMTSNVGAQEMAHARIGFGDTSNAGADDTAYKKLFSPEFRNRLDARISFSALSPLAMNRIVDKFVLALSTQLAEQNVTLKINDEARQYLAVKGYDKAMGARPLARVFQEEVKKPLADELLFGELENGGSVDVQLVEGKLVLVCKKLPKTRSAKKLAPVI